ncbi:MAG: ArsR family transcriptional regulator, zinc-responsive transcriptional repressor [Pseudonocardiales bacterium]|nr:ArsR family transcriptional regulator, zinc-responsive transcriptional repressor [Pseudonocardiales bacterium]
MTTLRSDTDPVDASIRVTAAEVSGQVAGQVSGPVPSEVHSAERPAAPPAPPRTPATLAAAGELLRALAAPVRIAIVLQLQESERCVHELVEALEVTQPLISQHLRVLKAAGVVAGERHGREVVYRLVDEHLAHIVMDAVAHAEEGT